MKNDINFLCVHKYDNLVVSAVAEVRQQFSYVQVCRKVVFICVDDDSYFAE